MSDLGDALDTLAGKVQAAGLRVSRDVRGVNPPCVLVPSPNVVSRLGACSLEEVVPVFVVAPPPGNADAEAWLLETLETLFGAIPDAVQAVRTTITVGAAEAPAYEIETRLTV